MTHLLQDLDGAKRHIFSARGQDFFLRVIVSSQKLREHPDVADLIAGTIMLDAQKELQSDLDKRGGRGKLLEITDGNPTNKDELAKKGFDPNHFNIARKLTKQEIDSYKLSFLENGLDGKSDTIFTVEDATGKIACAIYLTINDQSKRAELKVGEDINNFVYVSDIMTAPDFRGQNIFSSAFDKIVTMLANPKRNDGQSKSFQYAISVTAATELQSDGKQFHHIMNLPRYYKMWSDRFEDLSWMKRWQNIETGRQHAVGDPIGFVGKYDEQEISDFIANQKEEAASQGKKVRGAVLFGVMPGYDDAKEKRKNLMDDREYKGTTRNKTSEAGKGWVEKMQLNSNESQSNEKDRGK